MTPVFCLLRPFLLKLFFSLPPSMSSFHFLQETPARTEKGAGAQKTAHQKATKRLHALHERDACERGCRVHTEGECRHQSDPGTKGGSLSIPIRRSHFLLLVYLLLIGLNRGEITSLCHGSGSAAWTAQLVEKVQRFLSLLTVFMNWL